MKLIVLLSMSMLMFSSVAQTQSEMTNVESGSQQSITARIILKEGTLKNGQPNGRKELYISTPSGDTFIKVCECKVGKEALESAVDMGDYNLQVEFKQGAWDICIGDPADMESRIGDYVVINSIQKVKKKIK